MENHDRKEQKKELTCKNSILKAMKHPNLREINKTHDCFHVSKLLVYS